MEPILSLFILLPVVAVDSATNSSTYKDRNLGKLVRESVSFAEDGNRSATVGDLSPLPSNESIVSFLLVKPSSEVRGARRGKKIRHSQLRNNVTKSEVIPTSTNRTPSTDRFKSISHLKLKKTGDRRIVIREKDKVTGKSRAIRNVEGLSPMVQDDDNSKQQGIRGRRYQTDRYLYDSNLKNKIMFMSGERDSHLNKEYPEMYDSDRYYYNDFAADDNLSRMDGLSRPPTQMYGAYQQTGPRRFQIDSCRKYLEFLKYAFVQLESPSSSLYSNDQDEYYHNDGDHNKADPSVYKSYMTKPPPVITPDMKVLHSMALDNFQVNNKKEEVASIKGNDTKIGILSLPETNKSSNISKPHSSPLSLDVFTSGRGPIKHLESPIENQRQNTTIGTNNRINQGSTNNSIISLMVKNDTTISQNYDDKLFPCPDNINVTYPVNGYCNRFVACKAGKPHPEFCPVGLHFNLIEKQCDLPHNSLCTYSCPAADGYFAIPGDCGGFFRCTNWYPQYRLCPPLMHWDNKAKICAFEELSSCPLKCDSPHQVKPYRGVCNAYVTCAKGIPWYHQCPKGSHFDGNQLKCIPKHLSNCINDEDYITRNRGIANGKMTLCANLELESGGKARWCQEILEESKT